MGISRPGMRQSGGSRFIHSLIYFIHISVLLNYCFYSNMYFVCVCLCENVWDPLLVLYHSHFANHMGSRGVDAVSLAPWRGAGENSPQRIGTGDHLPLRRLGQDRGETSFVW